MPTLTTRGGVFTNAVLGFANIMLKLIAEEQPTHILVALDAGRKTFRNELFPEYKGHRPDAPSELKSQFALVEELVNSLGIKQVKIEGYEADDVIGTVSRITELHPDMNTLVVTGDKDLLQVVSSSTTVMLMKKGISENIKYTPELFRSTYGLEPLQMIDLKGLMGDTSDNIPGIKGVGEKTALKFLHAFSTVENLFDNTDKLKGKIKEKVEAAKEDALLSKQLATICRDVPVELDLHTFAFTDIALDTASEFFEKMEFRSLLDRIKTKYAGQVTTEKTESIDFTLVDASKMHDLVNSLSYVKSIHVESLGENPHTAELLGVAFHTATKNFFLPAEVLLLQGDPALDVKKWLADEKQPKLTHDLNRAKIVLYKNKMHLRGARFDTMLAAYLIDVTKDTSFVADVAMVHIPGETTNPGSEESVYGKGAKTKVPSPDVYGEHAVRKSVSVAILTPLLQKQLEHLDLRDLYYKLEFPLIDVLVKCETTGIKLDTEGLSAYGVEMKGLLSGLEKDIYSLAGEKFGIGSFKQLGDILFNKLGLPVVKKTKTGFSTDNEVLETLTPLHPIVGKIAQHRQITTLHTNFVEGLLKDVHKDGKIHTLYNPALTTTGRLSSQFPNMQNIPVRTEEGRRLRRFFVPSLPTSNIMAADYSQIELRVLAHISQDKNMVSAFIDKQDIHTRTAMNVYGVTEDAVTSDMRRAAKAVNFGIVFGISDYGLASNLSISRKEAEDFIQRYFDVFPGVKEYMARIVEEARECGYATTLLKRRRDLPDIKSSNFNVRSAAERMAMNTPIQGTAADIIKMAMLNMQIALTDKNMKSKMLLQVHDELVFDVVEEELDTMQYLVRDTMESAMTLSVPLTVDLSYGKSWYDAK